MRPLIDAFNENRVKGVIPGRHMVVDELMSSWRGAEAAYSTTGMPHVSKIKRKPEGVGAEIKAAADGSTSIIMRLDIMEGKQRQAMKEYSDLLLEGTAITLRVMKPWFSTGRIVHADSAFSSVYGLLQCRTHGLHFMGLVKTATKEFPINYLKKQADNYGHNAPKPRGGHIALVSDEAPDGTKHDPIWALGWYDVKAKFLVSSCGTTLPGNPSIRPRTRVAVENGDFVTVSYDKHVQRPKMVEDFFRAFSNIDVHDHYRQGSLEMERQWVTRNWTHRIFTTVLGVCIVDAYLAYKHESKLNEVDPEDILDLTTFCGRLSRQLIDNVLLQPRCTRSGKATPSAKVLTTEELQVSAILGHGAAA